MLYKPVIIECYHRIIFHHKVGVTQGWSNLQTTTNNSCIPQSSLVGLFVGQQPMYPLQASTEALLSSVMNLEQPSP